MVALLLALATAHPAVRHSAAWAAGMIIPFQIKAPWHSLERRPSTAARPARDGLAWIGGTRETGYRTLPMNFNAGSTTGPTKA